MYFWRGREEEERGGGWPPFHGFLKDMSGARAHTKQNPRTWSCQFFATCARMLHVSVFIYLFHPETACMWSGSGAGSKPAATSISFFRFYYLIILFFWQAKACVKDDLLVTRQIDFFNNLRQAGDEMMSKIFWSKQIYLGKKTKKQNKNLPAWIMLFKWSGLCLLSIFPSSEETERDSQRSTIKAVNNVWLSHAAEENQFSRETRGKKGGKKGGKRSKSSSEDGDRFMRSLCPSLSVVTAVKGSSFPPSIRCQADHIDAPRRLLSSR